jgi:hypothetical protein
MSETNRCRHCGTELTGKPYYTGNIYAKRVSDGREARINFYGGFVCCEECDFRACIAQESSMPGAGVARRPSQLAMRQISDNWGN